MSASLFPAHRRMYAAAFLLDFSVMIGLTAMPFFIFDRLGGGEALSGAVGAVQMALYSAGCLVSAVFVSGTRNVLRPALAGVGTFGCLFVLVPVSNSALPCLAAASTPFLGLALAWPAMQAWLGREPDPEIRARRLAAFNTATAFGFTLSPLFAGPLYDMDHRIPFAALFMLCAAAAGLLLSLPSDAETRKGPTGQKPESTAATDQFRPSPGLLYASWAATFTTNGLFAALRSVYPMRVKTLSDDAALTLWGGFRPDALDAAGPATVFSWLAFLLSLSTVACFFIMGRTTSWQGRFRPVLIGQAAAAASFLLLGRARSLAEMLLCFAVVGAAFGMCFFSSLYYSLCEASAGHRRAAINEGVLGAGGFAGGMAAGQAAGAVGITAAFQWAPLLIGAAAIIQLLLLRAGAPARGRG